MKKTLLLNPPSFDNFDGGAGARWPSTRETFSFWYPIWLAYPAGLIEGSRLLDAPPAGLGFKETVKIAKDYDMVAIFTSSAGYVQDLKLARMMKEERPDQTMVFVGPHADVLADKILKEVSWIDAVVRKEMDYTLLELAQDRPFKDILGLSWREKSGNVIHNAERPLMKDLDALPWVSDIYKRDLDIYKYNLPYAAYPYVSIYTTRGCPASCTFCLWPQTMAGHLWRKRSSDNVVAEMLHIRKIFPEVKEIVIDDDTFTIDTKRVVELCEKMKPHNFSWMCNARTTASWESLKAMKEAGCHRVDVGFETGDDQILKNIKKGSDVATARNFVKMCKELGIAIHGDFVVGLPGETPDTIEKSIRFAKELDLETIQVSIAQPLVGTEMYNEAKANGTLIEEIAGEDGFQEAAINYGPDLSREAIFKAVEHFYNSYYYRPKVIWRFLRKAMTSREEMKRLYLEAKGFFTWKSQRKKSFAKMNAVV